MEFTQEEIRKTIREALTSMQESDLVARKGDKSWSSQKKEFKEIISDLLNHIEDDKYEDAHDLIGDAVEILNTWKKRIKEGSGKVIDEEN
jgi:hypothetical protein